MTSVIRTIVHQSISSLIAGLLFCSMPVFSATQTITTTAGVFNVQVTSIEEARFQSTVRQERDFSCGSAALATVLTYHYEHPISEHDIFNAMYQNGDQQKIRHEGFSLLDMKNYLESEGFHADGFLLSLDELAKIGVPAIALINDEGYRHFVVVKGVDRRHVLLGDPAKGVRMMLRSQFEKLWNGITFVIRNKHQIAIRYFNHAKEWEMVAQAPLDTVIKRDGISNLYLSLPGLYEF